jgi:hypothetical protein
VTHQEQAAYRARYMWAVVAMTVGAFICLAGFASTPAADAATGQLPLGIFPAARYQEELPLNSTITIEAGPQFGMQHEQQAKANFVVTRGGRVVKRANGVLFSSDLSVGRSLGAWWSYQGPAQAATDTITATVTLNGNPVGTIQTVIQWVPPPPCTAIGLPSLFRAMPCSAAKNLLATAYDTGGCVAAVVSVGKLHDALEAAVGGGNVLKAAGNNKFIEQFANAVAELRALGAKVQPLIHDLHQGEKDEDLIQNIWNVLATISGHQGAGAIAAALLNLAGFGPCVDLIQNTSRPPSTPPTTTPTPTPTPTPAPTPAPPITPAGPTPPPGSVLLSTLCSNDDVSIDAVNGCPYSGQTGNFSYTILIEDNEDSVTPEYWDLIDFPETTCTSISLSFAMPTDGSAPGDTASIAVVGQSGSAQSASVGYGQTATLNVTLDGGPWSLQNSATSSEDEIAVNGYAACSTASGY